MGLFDFKPCVKIPKQHTLFVKYLPKLIFPSNSRKNISWLNFEIPAFFAYAHINISRTKIFRIVSKYLCSKFYPALRCHENQRGGAKRIEYVWIRKYDFRRKMDRIYVDEETGESISVPVSEYEILRHNVVAVNNAETGEPEIHIVGAQTTKYRRIRFQVIQVFVFRHFNINHNSDYFHT